MRKKLLPIALSLVTILFCSSIATAQFNLAAGFAFNKYGGEYGKSHPAFQPRIGYLFATAKLFIDVGANLSPMTGKNSFSFDAVNEEGFIMEGELTQKVNIQNIFFRAGRVIGNPDNDFFFKIYVGASIDYLNIHYSKNVPEGYMSPDVKDETLQGPKVDIGFSGEFRLSAKGNLFAEFCLGMPATHVNDVAIQNPTVRHIGLSVGYKLYIGNRDNIEFNSMYGSPFGSRGGY